MQKNFPISLQLMALLGLFLLTRIWPLAQFEPWSSWDVYQARKFDQYGLLERKGALLDIHFMNGVIPNPDKFNYTNHPAPIHWINTLFLKSFGDWGVPIFATLLGGFGVLAGLIALKRFFPPPIAFVGAVLFLLAPSSIIYDVDPNHGALGAAVWPFATTALALAGNWWAAALLGLICFITGQMSWLVWIVFPSLLVLVVGLHKSLNWQWNSNNKMLAGFAIGSTLTILFFLLQVYFYTPDWDRLFQYVGKQSILQIGVKEWGIRMATRVGMSLGPSLLLGAVLGIVLLAKRKKISSLELAALLFFPFFIFASIILRGFFYRENWPYEYALFPSVILTCSALSQISSDKLQRFAIILLLGLSALSLSYVYLRFSNPILSPQTEFIADLLSNESKQNEVIATNLEDQLPPLPFWNVSGLGMAANKADRLIRKNVRSKNDLLNLLENFQTNQLDIFFVRCVNLPTDSMLSSELDQMEFEEFQLPSGNTSLHLSLRLREFFWKISGRHQVAESNYEVKNLQGLKVYRFQISINAKDEFEISVK
jgi:hypothetical protein